MNWVFATSFYFFLRGHNGHLNLHCSGVTWRYELDLFIATCQRYAHETKIYFIVFVSDFSMRENMWAAFVFSSSPFEIASLWRVRQGNLVSAAQVGIAPLCQWTNQCFVCCPPLSSHTILFNLSKRPKPNPPQWRYHPRLVTMQG